MICTTGLPRPTACSTAVPAHAQGHVAALHDVREGIGVVADPRIRLSCRRSGRHPGASPAGWPGRCNWLGEILRHQGGHELRGFVGPEPTHTPGVAVPDWPGPRASGYPAAAPPSVANHARRGSGLPVGGQRIHDGIAAALGLGQPPPAANLRRCKPSRVNTARHRGDRNPHQATSGSRVLTLVVTRS
jgi:hypothetical protein